MMKNDDRKKKKKNKKKIKYNVSKTTKSQR